MSEWRLNFFFFFLGRNKFLWRNRRRKNCDEECSWAGEEGGGWLFFHIGSHPSMTRCLRLLRIAPIDGVVPVCVCVCVSSIDITEKCFIKLFHKTKIFGRKTFNSNFNFFKKNLKSLRQLCRTTIQCLKCFHMSIHTIVGFQSAPSCAAAQQMALASGAHFLPTERCAVGQKKEKKTTKEKEREREKWNGSLCSRSTRPIDGLAPLQPSVIAPLLATEPQRQRNNKTTKKKKKKRGSQVICFFGRASADYRPSENVD